MAHSAWQADEDNLQLSLGRKLAKNCYCFFAQDIFLFACSSAAHSRGGMVSLVFMGVDLLKKRIRQRLDRGKK